MKYRKSSFGGVSSCTRTIFFYCSPEDVSLPVATYLYHFHKTKSRSEFSSGNSIKRCAPQLSQVLLKELNFWNSFPSGFGHKGGSMPSESDVGSSGFSG